MADGRSPSELEADGKERASKAEPKNQGEQLPVEERETTETDEKLKQQEEEEAQLHQTIEESESFLYFMLWFILFGFGTLAVIAVAAIIFYLLNYAAQLFDFDFSEYASYIAVGLSIINVIMSCFGCWGTYTFSALQQDSENELRKVTEDLKNVGKDLETDNADLRISLRKIEVKLAHFDNENLELQATLNDFARQEDEMQRIVKKESEKYVSLSDLWSMWQIQETNDIILKIVSITCEYYHVAYQDLDTEDGLNEEQYKTLILQNPEIPKDERVIFPPFDHTVWEREKEGDPILVDELERISAMVYKYLLDYKLTYEQLDSDKQGPAFDLTTQVLEDKQQKADEANAKDDEEEDDGFWSNPFKRLLGD
eukprot:130122_1